MHDEVTPAEDRCLIDHFVNGETDRRVVRCDDRTGTHADHHPHGNVIPDEFSEDTEMGRAAKAASAQHYSDANVIRKGTHGPSNLFQADSNTISRE